MKRVTKKINKSSTRRHLENKISHWARVRDHATARLTKLTAELAALGEDE